MAQEYIDGGPEAGNKIMTDFDEAASSLYDEVEPFVKEQLESLEKKINFIHSLLNLLVIIAVISSVLVVTLGIVSRNTANKLKNESNKKDILDLEKMYDEIELITNKVLEGNLDYRTDEKNFDGKYKNIILGINSVLDSLIGHINNIPLPV